MTKETQQTVGASHLGDGLGMIKFSKRCVPIDYAAIANESGMSKGKIFYSKTFGWVVGNTSGNPDWPDMACITPPTLQPGEKLLQVKDNLWVFS